ncbi:MAG: hypothetical protein ABFD92_13540 [Planctomycetaceae bacterium]|nr:hypothetical protein [Planctomycetaceae bacterium]
MNLTDYLVIDDVQLRRFDDMYARYRRLYDDPGGCQPMIIVNTPLPPQPTWQQRLADPLVMLQSELDAIRPHLELGDDRVPTVRVQFGTAQVAAAFGCRMHINEDSPPAAGTSVMSRAQDVYDLEIPPLDAGWYGKLAQWTEIWKANLPPGVHIQHPDIQSAFNSAHLIRGNDIMTDFFDHPAELDLLLDKVTDFMLAITRHVKAAISDDRDWFFDWGSMWKGAARISNCTMQLISPELYRRHVLSRDVRFLETIGGGRMHYCGITGAVIDDFLAIPALTGLDIDVGRHDFFDLCDRTPPQVVLVTYFDGKSPQIERLLRGQWPRKRNIIMSTSAPSVDEGRRLLEKLRDSIPG